MKNIIKNFIEVINIIVFDWLKPLTIGLYEVIVNIVFTVATSVLNLALEPYFIFSVIVLLFFSCEESRI